MTQTAPDSLSSRLDDQLARCIRCGLCLPACPTYQVFRTEMDAPRGRLALMRAAWESPGQAGDAAREHLDLCLGCLACETACPSGVEYGDILHQTRTMLEKERPRSAATRFVRRLALRMLPRRALLHFLAAVTGFKQSLGLFALARRLPLPGILARMLRMLPPRVRRFRPSTRVVPATGKTRGKVAFFRGCVQDAFLGDVNDATVRVLRRNGWEVHLPEGQTCCGAAAQHAGEAGMARELARRNLAAFEAGGYDAVVNNAGGCGAMLREYTHLFPAGSDENGLARRFVERVRDVSELLAAGLTAEPAGEIRARATYADSCHLRHAQGVVRQPRELLRRIPGLHLVELRDADHCCGSAGTYNLTQGETADRLLERKMERIAATGAELVVVTNTGCHLQLLDGVRRAGLDAEVVHLVQLLERSYAAAD